MKLIIRYDDDINIRTAVSSALAVIEQGRISHNRMGDQFCFHTMLNADNQSIHVSAFKPSSKTDTLVVYKEIIWSTKHQ